MLRKIKVVEPAPVRRAFAAVRPGRRQGAHRRRARCVRRQGVWVPKVQP